MHKRSIFSSRFDQKRQDTELQWLRAFNKSKLFPKIRESMVQNAPQKGISLNKPVRKCLLNNNEWYDSDKISITDRYLLEQKLNINLLEKSERESIVLFVSSEEKPEIRKVPSKRKSLKVPKVLTNLDKVMILEDILKVEVLEETLHDLNIQKIMEPSSKYPSNTPNIPVTHSDGMFVCFYCDKRFKRFWILSNHIQLHTGVKQFPCSKCPHAFADLSNLRSHQRSKGHHDWKFACTQCSKAFRNVQLLDRHTIHACRRYLKKSKKVM